MAAVDDGAWLPILLTIVRRLHYLLIMDHFSASSHPIDLLCISLLENTEAESSNCSLQQGNTTVCPVCEVGK